MKLRVWHQSLLVIRCLHLVDGMEDISTNGNITHYPPQANLALPHLRNRLALRYFQLHCPQTRTEVTTSITVETTNETDLPSTTAFDSASTITLSTTHTTVETVDSSSSFVTEAADISNGVIQEDIDTTPTTLISAAIVLVICALLIWVLAYFVIRSARSKPRGSKQSAPQHGLEMVVSTTGKDYSLHELDEICKEEKQEEGVIFTSKSEHEDETQDDDDGLRLDQGMFTCWQCGDRLIHTKGVKHGEGQDALCITCQLIDKRNNCTDESDDGLWDDMDDNAGQNAIVEVTTPRGETPRY
eukprot:1078390_1